LQLKNRILDARVHRPEFYALFGVKVKAHAGGQLERSGILRTTRSTEQNFTPLIECRFKRRSAKCPELDFVLNRFLRPWCAFHATENERVREGGRSCTDLSCYGKLKNPITNKWFLSLCDFVT
jgi:hypothetical protein